MSSNKLLKNTFMLYLLTGSNYLFGLVMIPYLTRVLGAEVYGRVGFAMAFAQIIQIFIDFGFQLSGVIAVANNQGDQQALERIISSIALAKIMLMVPTFAAILVLCLVVQRFQADWPMFILYFLYAVFNSFVPDYYYRGIENMTTVTLRNVVMKGIFTGCIVIFVKNASDYMLVPCFYVLGALAGLLVVFNHMKKTMGIWFVRVAVGEALEQLRLSFLFFVSRIAASIYTSFNAIVLGMMFPSGPTVGYYTACNNAVSAGTQAITPITDSLFPHIVKTKNYSLLNKVLLGGEAILICGCAIVFMNSKFLCTLVFGSDFANAHTMLRILLPLIPINYASYLFAWSGLGSLGLERISNQSVVIGSGIHICSLLILWVLGIKSATLICCTAVATNAIVMLIRGVAFYRHAYSR